MKLFGDIMEGAKFRLGDSTFIKVEDCDFVQELREGENFSEDDGLACDLSSGALFIFNNNDSVEDVK